MPNDILRREADRLRHLSETCAQQGDCKTARQLLKMVIEIEESDVGVAKESYADFSRTWMDMCPFGRKAGGSKVPATRLWTCGFSVFMRMRRRLWKQRIYLNRL